MKTAPAVLAAIVYASAPLCALAGVTDTPLPQFSDGAQSELVGILPTVVKNNGVETAIICTNTSAQAVNVGVEVFDKTGALVNSVAADNGAILSVPVGATVTIATSGTALLSEDERITQLPDLRNGSGRVVATSSTVACNAMLLDELHAIEDPTLSVAKPPTFVGTPVWACNNSRRDPFEECDDGGFSWQVGDGCRADCASVACADPDDSGSTVATDALLALRASVGLLDCDVCVCDVDASGAPVTAVDALRILSFAVGVIDTLQCSACG